LAAISSIAALISNPHAPAYNACKAFQSNYIFALQKKSLKEKSNIAITDIRPGFVDTAMAKGDGLFWVGQPRKSSPSNLQGHQTKKRSGLCNKTLVAHCICNSKITKISLEANLK
jgi:short-subunit dehydrogenase